MAEPIRCPYCRQRHMPRFLCDPAKAMLDAVQARGESFSMPTVTFDAPIHDPGIGLAPGDQMLRQFVVKGAAVELTSGVTHPALVFTGRGIGGAPLPQWLYVATDEELRAGARLVDEMTELAIRTADAANPG